MKLRPVLGATIGGAIVLAFLPLACHNQYLMHVAVIAFIFAALTASWNLVGGYGGMFTFGHQAFFGLGAYTAALLAINLGWSPYAGIFAGGMFATIAGIIIGVPVLRLRGAPYISIATLAFAEVVRIIADNLTKLTHGETGLVGIPTLPSFALPGIGQVTFSLADSRPYYYVSLMALVAVLVIVGLLLSTRVGLALGAIRDSPEAAESLGVALTTYKVLIFLTSSFIAGCIGGLYAFVVSVLTPSTVLSVEIMVQIIAMALIGGLGTFFGPVLGALILTVGLELLRAFSDWQLVIYGALLVVVVIALPGGLISLPKRITEIAGRIVSAPKSRPAADSVAISNRFEQEKP